MASSPGTPTDSPEATASMKRSGRPSAARKRSGVAAAGAVSRPSQAAMVLFFAS
jgi:hypothetical protein